MDSETLVATPAQPGAVRAARPGWRSGWRSGWRADAVALGLGLLSAAALPPVHLIPVLLIAVPGLLGLIDRSRTPWVALRRGWWFGFGNHLLGLYWITEAILFEAARLWWAVPLAVPALAALLACFIAVPCAVARLLPPGPGRVWALAGTWVLTELARQFVGTGFPWNPWGSVWTIPGMAGDVMIQPAALVSVHGLTLATLLIAAAPVWRWRGRIAAAAVLAAWAGFGLWRLSLPAPPAPGVTAVLVQGDVQQGQKWNAQLARDIFDRYLDLTRAGLAQAGTGKRVVVWPETASPYALGDDAAAREMVAGAAGGVPVIAGTVRFDPGGRPRNSLAVILPDGSDAGFYDKWHLVPFGEFQPSWFPLPFQVVPGGGFAFGSGPKTLAIPGIPSPGPLICYEAIYPGQIVDEAHRPDWLVNITNDAWFGNSSGPRQHLAGVRLRAVEEGLPILRAANTGITAAFDWRGHELARIPRNQPGFLTVELPGAGTETLFARLGHALPLVLALCALAAGVFLSLVTSRLRDPGMPGHGS